MPATYFVVHKQPSDCAQAKIAYLATEEEAEIYRLHPECLACGWADAYEVKKRPEEREK